MSPTRNNRVVFLLAISLLFQAAIAMAQEADSGTITFSMGGRIKLDSIYSSRANPGARDTNSSDIAFVPASIVVDGSSHESKYTIDLRTSRLWTKWHFPLGNEALSAFVEVDMLASKRGAGGVKHLTSQPRLRHYYLDYRGFTLGQTNTTFLNASAFPEINDLNGPVGVALVRQRLLRFRHNFAWGDAQIAVEESELTLDTATGTKLAPNDERFPDFTGKFTLTGEWGNWSLSWLLREIINRDGPEEDSEWGGAINLSGRLYLLERDTLRLSLVYGNALGRYISYGVFADGAVDNSGDIDLTPVISANMSYQHWWTAKLRTNIVLGAAHADNNRTLVAGTVNRQFYSSHLNLLWSPRLDMTVGLEWLHGYRELEDGRSGHLNRIQLTAMYRF